MEVNASKRTWFSVTCLLKVPSTTNPRSASWIAGVSTRPIPRLPHCRSAVVQVSGVPGAPTDTPLVTSSGENRYG